MSRKSNRFVVPLLALVVLLASCAQFFQGKIAIDSQMSDTKLTDLVPEKTVIERLEPPEAVYVSRSLSSDRIYISWEKVYGASYYRLERAVVTAAEKDGSFAEPDEEAFEVVSKFVYGTSYTDVIFDKKEPNYRSLEYGYGYFYRVSAENPGKKYEPSDFAVSEAGTLFSPVMEIAATQGEDSAYIEVNWAKTTGASSYKVYRSAYKDGSGSSLLSSVPANQNWYKNEIDTAAQGTEFYYSVYAVNSGGQTTPVSPVALGYSLVEGAPGRVEGVRVTEGRGDTTGSITIEWNPASGNGDVTYSVYRTSSEDSASTLLTDKCTATTYTDSKALSQNVYYYYQVLAYTVDEEQNRLKGPISKSSSADKEPAEGFILSAPSSLSVVYAKEAGKCAITFPASIGSSAYSQKPKSPAENNYVYRIYTCETETGTFMPVEDKDESNLSVIEGHYTVTVDAAKFYKVSTVYSDSAMAEIESKQSPVAAPAPYAAENLVATQHAYIQYVTDGGVDGSGKANSNGVYPVRVSWDEPDGGADGGYYIYRSTKADSGFRKVNDIPLTATEYIDSYDAAKPGTLYYYRVLSLNSLQQGANYSNIATGWGALTHNQYMREYNKTIKNSHKKLTYMHKSPDTAKLGSEEKDGDLRGTVSYNAKMDGLGARILMHYEDYTDFSVQDEVTKDVYYFSCTGDTNTSASMDASGTMDGTVRFEGMYPGTVGYGKIKIKGGNAGGGVYVITQDGFESGDVDYKIGDE